MQLARLEAYRNILNAKSREELIDAALYYYRESSERAEELSLLRSTWQEMIIQFQQMKDELGAARTEVNALRELNRHLTGIREIQDKNLFGRRTEKADALFRDALDESPKADPLSEDADCDAQDAPEESVFTGRNIFSYEQERRKKSKGKRDADLSKLPKQVFYDYDINRLDEEYGRGNWRFAYWIMHRSVELVRQYSYLKVTYTPVVSYGLEHMMSAIPYDGALIPKSLVSSSLMSAVMTDKYGLYLPLNRQSSYPDRFGMSFSRQTLSNWTVRLTLELLEPVFEYLKEIFIPYKYQQCDETTYLVILSGKAPGSKGYIWVHRSSSLMDAPQIILYCYENSRSADHLRNFYEGLDSHIYLSCDAYGAYPAFEKDSSGCVTICGCLMHARRRFADAVRILKIKGLPAESVQELPEVKAISLIRDIYKEEDALSDLSPEERLGKRQLAVKPLVDDFFAFIHGLDPSDPGYSDKLKDAILYSIHQENELRQFLNDGNIPIDNGASERSVKPIALGRKNYLFSNSLDGAKTTIILSSLIATSKANGADPYYYLKYLLELMPRYVRGNIPIPDKDILLPWSEAYRAYETSEKQSVLDLLKAPPGNQKPRTPRKRDKSIMTDTA